MPAASSSNELGHPLRTQQIKNTVHPPSLSTAWKTGPHGKHPTRTSHSVECPLPLVTSLVKSQELDLTRLRFGKGHVRLVKKRRRNNTSKLKASTLCNPQTSSVPNERLDAGENSCNVREVSSQCSLGKTTSSPLPLFNQPPFAKQTDREDAQNFKLLPIHTDAPKTEKLKTPRSVASSSCSSVLTAAEAPEVPELEIWRKRPYINQLLSSALDQKVSMFFSEFQKTAISQQKLQQCKTSLERRKYQGWIFGLQECKRRFRLLSCVFVATDLQESRSTPGGLNETLFELHRLGLKCEDEDTAAECGSPVPVIFALTRSRIKRICQKGTRQSCVGILKKAPLSPTLRQMQNDVFTLAQKLQTEFREQCSEAAREFEEQMDMHKQLINPHLTPLELHGRGPT